MVNNEYHCFISALEGELQHLERVGSAEWRQKRVTIALHTAEHFDSLAAFLDYKKALENVRQINPELNSQCSVDVAKYLYNAALQT